MSAAAESQVLVLCYGNPVREDDGLGPALALELEEADISGISVDADYQLQVEDAVAASKHKVVIFADAAAEGEEPFSFRKLESKTDIRIDSHSVDPETIMGLARRLSPREREGYLLGIRGYSFRSFTEGLGEKARQNLDSAKEFLSDFLRNYMDTDATNKGRFS